MPPSHFYQAAVQRIAIHRFCCLFVFTILYAASENCHVQAHRGTETGGGAVSDAVTAHASAAVCLWHMWQLQRWLHDGYSDSYYHNHSDGASDSCVQATVMAIVMAP